MDTFVIASITASSSSESVQVIKTLMLTHDSMFRGIFNELTIEDNLFIILEA